MIASPVAASPPGSAPTYHVVTGDGTMAARELPEAERGAALHNLMEQEIHGLRGEVMPARVAELLHTFGFEWEPLCEPGHMRVLDQAAYLVDRAKQYATVSAAGALRALGVPCLTLDGVSIVDAGNPALRDYLELTSGGADLYGGSRYEVRGAGILRQTSCFQKYSACLDHDLASAALPVALFEISDSFRREPEETLQLSCRLRRFHLPEAHLHSRSLADAVDLSHGVNAQILRLLAELDAELVLLINTSYEFATAYPDYFTRLAEQANTPALLRVGAPGQRCMDGVEVDVEYKIVDALGYCRELSTFQIDELITRDFGVRCDDGNPPATIHTVFTGSVERYLFAVLDRIARAEATGTRRHLPLWLAPVQVRVVPADAGATQAALTLAGRLALAGVRTQVDDRQGGLAAAIADADAYLVPYLVRAGENLDVPAPVCVRSYGSDVFRECDIDELVSSVRLASAQPTANEPQRLSRRPFIRAHAGNTNGTKAYAGNANAGKR